MSKGRKACYGSKSGAGKYTRKRYSLEESTSSFFPWWAPIPLDHKAVGPDSPVLILITFSRLVTKILPSPILPVFAESMMLSIT